MADTEEQATTANYFDVSDDLWTERSQAHKSPFRNPEMVVVPEWAVVD